MRLGIFYIVLCAALGGCASRGIADPAQQAGAGPVRASELPGTPVRNASGERLGTIFGVLLDTRPGGQHYALLFREEGGEEKRFAYPVNAFWRNADGALLLLRVRERYLEVSPGYQQRDWPSAELGVERYVRARDVLGQPVLDTLGARVGIVRDLVLNLDTARMQSALVDFAAGGVLPMPGHAVRLSPGGPVTLHTDSQRRS